MPWFATLHSMKSVKLTGKAFVQKFKRNNYLGSFTDFLEFIVSNYMTISHSLMEVDFNIFGAEYTLKNN